MNWIDPLWTLAELQHVDPRDVLRGADDSIGRYFLALAAWNDLKGGAMFEQYLLQFGRPPASDLSALAGQWRGIHVHIHRLIAGILAETFNIIDEWHFKVPSDVKERLARELGDEQWARWTDLLAEVRSKGKGTFNRLIKEIRNSGGYHYDERELASGFLEHFTSERSTAPQRRTAQFAFGRSMEESRFFFADAAAQQLTMMKGSLRGATLPTITSSSWRDGSTSLSDRSFRRSFGFECEANAELLDLRRTPPPLATCVSRTRSRTSPASRWGRAEP